MALKSFSMCHDAPKALDDFGKTESWSYAAESDLLRARSHARFLFEFIDSRKADAC